MKPLANGGYFTISAAGTATVQSNSTFKDHYGFHLLRFSAMKKPIPCYYLSREGTKHQHQNISVAPTK